MADFDSTTITLEFTSGSTKDKIIEYVSQDPLPPATERETTIQKATIHVLVPHHSQRIYDDPNDLKYEYTINYVAKDGWEEVTEKKEPSPYEVNKMESADKIADATKETIYTLSLMNKCF